MGQGLCEECRKAEENQFWQVANYLRDHPGVQLETIAQGTKVDIQRILKFIKDGRLQVSRPLIPKTCENCKKPIKEGKYCAECSALMTRPKRKIKRPLGGKIDFTK
jgi:hypothetical protein